MYCRYCGAEMPEDQAVCPACGKADIQPDIQPESKPKKNLLKPIIAGVCCLALIVGLGAAIWFGMNPEDPGSTRASYTGTDEQVLGALDAVVATAGSFELTNRELQIAYWASVYDFLSYYGDYAAYWIDFEKPLDQQYFDESQTRTWQQYFLESAIKTWQRYEVLVAMSKAEGIAMSQELEDYFAKLPDQMKESLSKYGFENIDQMVVHDFGVGSSYASYEEFMKLYHYSNEQYQRLFERLTATDAEIEAFYAEKEADFVNAGYSKDDGSIVDVRHILIAPGEDDEKPYTDAQWTAAEAKATLLLNIWLQGEADEESFAALAKEHSACGSAPQGGLITDITKGQMVEEFEAWCMEPHEYGDYGIVKTVYGYHLMFYVDGVELWYDLAKSNVLSEKISDLLLAEEEKYPLTIHYDKIWLGQADLG